MPDQSHPGRAPENRAAEFGAPESGALDELLTPGEVAAILRVNAKTVARWAAEGKLAAVRTPGGHRRFRTSHVRALLAPPGSPEDSRGADPGSDR